MWLHFISLLYFSFLIKIFLWKHHLSTTDLLNDKSLGMYLSQEFMSHVGKFFIFDGFRQFPPLGLHFKPTGGSDESTHWATIILVIVEILDIITIN